MKKLLFVIKKIFRMDFKSFFATINKIHKRSGKNRVLLFFDMIYCGFKYQAGYIDYFLFGFEELSKYQRSTYITRGVNDRYIKTMNDSSYYSFFSDKIKFNDTFKKYLKRDYLDIRDGLDDFKSFVEKHDVFIAKVVSSSGGYGVSKYEVNKKTNVDDLYQELLDKKQYLVEECIVQHKDMSKVSSSSVNTIRIVTARKNGKTTILLRVVRFGNGISHVDNFHSGGMYTHMDSNGVIIYPALDRESRVFEEHPKSKVKFVGFKVPYAKEAFDLAVELSKVIPEVGLVGWDIAVTKDGPVLVEGNELPGYDLYQARAHLDKDKLGKKLVFDKVIYGSEDK